MNLAMEAPSTVLPPPVRLGEYRWQDGVVGSEFEVGPYQVVTRPDWLGAERRVDRSMSRRERMCSFVLLQVCRSDGGSVFDWRDLQQIKSLVCGPAWEAVELFPAETRLKDPSNARYLWCAKGSLPFGLPGGRVVIDAHLAAAPQRPLPVTGGAS